CASHFRQAGRGTLGRRGALLLWSDDRGGRPVIQSADQSFDFRGARPSTGTRARPANRRHMYAPAVSCEMFVFALRTKAGTKLRLERSRLVPRAHSRRSRRTKFGTSCRPARLTRSKGESI